MEKETGALYGVPQSSAFIKIRDLCKGKQEQKLSELGKTRDLCREGEGRDKTSNQWDVGSGVEHKGRNNELQVINMELQRPLGVIYSL